MRSLRGRLSLGVVLLLAFVLGAALIAVSRYVENSERDALDERLERTAELSQATVATAVQQELPQGDTRLDAVLKASGASLRLVLGESEPLFKAGRQPPPHKARRGFQTMELDGRRYRILVVDPEDKEIRRLGLVTLEVTTTLGPIERRIDRLNDRLTYLWLGALFVTGLGTWLTATFALRPLRRLRLVTATIAADEDLSRRVPPDDGPKEIRAVARSFNAMLGRLSRSAEDRNRALKATRRFAADAGHELRTPLTAVQATLSALARHPGLDAAKRTSMAEDALAEQRRLVDLLDGLQALARGDAAPGEDAEVDLAEIVAEAVASSGRAGMTRIEVDLPDGPVPLTGWDTGLRVLVSNLVENASRHGKPGGSVTVRLDPSGPRLIVDDDGPGIPQADRERIFEPFTRLDGVDRPGSGLGLALVAQQARHHGATVEVSDSPAGGARFVVTFGRR